MHEESPAQFKRRKFRFAKLLRRRMTNAEEVLWKHLRSKQLDGLKFRRQVPIGSYIVDFICFQKRIVIEVDGGIHEQQKQYDRYREQALYKQGLKVVRFTNEEVIDDLQNVLDKIKEVTSNF